MAIGGIKQYFKKAWYEAWKKGILSQINNGGVRFLVELKFISEIDKVFEKKGFHAAKNMFFEWRQALIERCESILKTDDDR